MGLRGTATIAIALFVAGVITLRAFHREETVVQAVDAATSAPPVASVSQGVSHAGAQATAFYGGHNPPYKVLSGLGKVLFSDRTLSANGERSCETCHAPAFAYGPPPDAPIGRRAIPSLRYAMRIPSFSLHHVEEDGSDSGPTGGFMWDGRANSEHEQARLPLLSETEMGNVTEEALAARIRASKSAEAIKAAFGENAFATDASTIRTVLLSLEVWEQSPPDFAPYDSKYDEVLRKKATLSEQEARGQLLFDRRDKGNCSSCHRDQIGEGGFPAFTDYGVIALGVPLKKGAAPDRGACDREDLKDHPELCGAFRTPTLRNTARRNRYFHNGVVTSLKDVVRFYATRDSNPSRWAPTDHENENMDPPFGKKTPSLTETEIDDIVAFLGTLNDGWKP